MSAPTLADAIHEIFAHARDCEFRAERTRECAATFAAHDPNHARQIEAAEQWEARVRALDLGGQALQAIAPFASEVKTLIQQIRDNKGGRRGRRSANA